MDINFGALSFHVNGSGDVSLVKFWSVDNRDMIEQDIAFKVPIIDLAGGDTSGRRRLAVSDAAQRLKYVSHRQEETRLILIQENESVRVTSVYQAYDDTNAVRVTQQITNITDEPICLELAHTIGLHFGRSVTEENRRWHFHRFTNTRYAESAPMVQSFYELGMYCRNAVYRMVNVGNVSALEYVPQGIVEDRRTGDHLMFQIESYSGWYAELSVENEMFCLQLGGPNAHFHAWNKVLAPGESYRTVPVAVCHGASLNETAAQITRYRRHIMPWSQADAHLPAIYNEYMHYSWDDPFQRRTVFTAPYVAKTGTEYYVIDCGWHNSPEADNMLSMYRLFGTWHEDRERFPDGIKAVSDHMHSLGMKFGLWIAPEVVGCENTKMLEYYTDDCFLQRNGKKIFHGTGYLLDYRHPKVRDYMTKTIDRMVLEYGCDYIKFDGCPNPGFGTDLRCTSPGDGLEGYIDAFTEWSAEMTARHPHVIFEDCAGGGLRTDYKALSIFHLISTSDQGNYLQYPYITGNIFMSVLPEQAAVWSYPVDSAQYDPEHEAWTNERVSKEQVIMNMVNAVLGRIHLASRIYLLDEEKQALIKEGVDFYKRIAEEKKRAVPYFPLGYTAFGSTSVAVGIRTDRKLYLAVWNLNGERDVTLPLQDITVESVTTAYPKSLETSYSFTDHSVTVHFSEDEQARVFELTLR